MQQGTAGDGREGLRRALEWLVCGRKAKWGGGCRLRCSGVGANENRGEGPFLMASGQLKGLLGSRRAAGAKISLL